MQGKASIRIIHRWSTSLQITISIVAVSIVASICFAVSAYLHYQVVAFILLLLVSLISILFDIVPVLICALVSALAWDYFFIPPRFTLQIGGTEDRILLGMYFVVAVVSAILTQRLRKLERAAQQEESREQTIKLYNTLLNSLSHELRTPIATIIAATDNLQEASPKLTALNRHELLAEISKASLRLNQQVENLLNMSRLESGAIRPRADWCDVEEMVYEAVKRVEENKPAQRLNISVPPSLPLVKLDKGMLEQVLYNLLNNAITHTPPETTVSVSARCDADVLELLVEDSGQGFPPAEVEKVFDKFYRLQHSATGGTGLGLSIVRGFTAALGGSVDLTNLSTGGARFAVVIPTQTSYVKNLKHE